MKIDGIQTHHITKNDTNINVVLEKYITQLTEKSIVIITSKIVSICEGSIVPIGSIDKDELIKKEAECYIPRDKNKYNVCLTITRGILAPSAGIDESNADSHYILWPKNPQQSANEIRSYLKDKFKLKDIGVLIIDSKTSPLRWGTTGLALSWSGFMPLKNYIGEPDIFGRIMKMTNQSIIDGLASSANLVMGEGNEATPIAVADDIPFVEFVDRNPTDEEITSLQINPEDDLYEALITNAPWVKG